MQKMLSFAVGLAALTLASVASAQFDGPAPLAWRWQQSSTTSPGGSPLVVADTIFQSLGGRVFSIDKDTANLKWRFPALDPIDGTFRNAPIMANGTLVVAGDNKIIYGVDPTSGQLKWSFPTSSAVYGSPVLVGKKVVCATAENQLVAINPDDGSAVWTKPYNIYDGIQGTLGVSGSDVIICTTNTKVIALNTDTQKFHWTKQFSQLPPGPTPICTGDRIYLTSGPFLVALNAENGNPFWQVDTRMQLVFAPAVSESGIMVVSNDGKALVYSTEHVLKTKTPIVLGSVPITRPTPVGSKFIVPTSNGGLVLVDPTTGKSLWDYIIRPIDEITYAASSSKTGGGGKGGQGPGAPGGPSGGGFGGGGLGGGGQTNKDADRIYYIQASAPAVLAGETLLVPARDGSLLAFDKDLGVDLTPPVVTMTFPNPGEQVSGQPPLLLLFKIVDDNSGLQKDSVKIRVDGHDLEHTITKEGLFLVRFSLTGTNKPLMDGRRTFVVTASDWMGNESKTEVSLTIDNTLPPMKLANDTNNPKGGPGGGKGGSLGGGGGGSGAGASG